MASVSACNSICNTNLHHRPTPHSPCTSPTSVQFKRNGIWSPSLSVPHMARITQKFKNIRLVAAAEEDIQNLEQDDASNASSAADEAVAAQQTTSDPTVSVPVSPSDKLLMRFQAEGTINESAILDVTKAFQGTEGISDLKVEVSEGIASVELIKQTTIQATGVASGLVETIQGSGFKLQTLYLSFDDEEVAVA